MALDSTCKIAVPWENDEAPTAMPCDASGDRNVLLRGVCPKLPRIRVRSIAVFKERGDMLTHEKPGDGIASVPRIKESFSAWYGFAGRSYGTPLTLTAVRTESDRNPRAPPIACNLRFVRAGRSRFGAEEI